MKQPQKAPGRSILCVELELPLDGSAEWARVTLSRPGAAGAVSRQWGTQGRSMTEYELADLLAYIQRSVSHAIESRGIQQAFVLRL